MALSFALTVFIFLNSYEVVFNKDLPYISAVKTVNLDSIQASYPLSPQIDSPTFDTKTFGDPISLKVSGGKAKVSLVPAIFNDNKWLARSNAGQITSFTINGFSDNLFVYMREDVRTIQTVRQVRPGDNMQMDTVDGFRYLFRVSDVQTIGTNSPFILQKTQKPQIFIVIQDKNQTRNQIITGNFVTKEQQ
jgi:hypothetical protein